MKKTIIRKRMTKMTSREGMAVMPLTQNLAQRRDLMPLRTGAHHQIEDREPNLPRVETNRLSLVV